jgi:hypothetical protein
MVIKDGSNHYFPALSILKQSFKHHRLEKLWDPSASDKENFERLILPGIKELSRRVSDLLNLSCGRLDFCVSHELLDTGELILQINEVEDITYGFASTMGFEFDGRRPDLVPTFNMKYEQLNYLNTANPGMIQEIMDTQRSIVAGASVHRPVVDTPVVDTPVEFSAGFLAPNKRRKKTNKRRKKPKRKKTKKRKRKKTKRKKRTTKKGSKKRRYKGGSDCQHYDNEDGCEDYSDGRCMWDTPGDERDDDEGRCIDDPDYEPPYESDYDDDAPRTPRRSRVQPPRARANQGRSRSPRRERGDRGSPS